MSEHIESRVRIADACDIAYRYGQIDGSHHRLWVVDQMVRALLGDDAYREWVKAYEKDNDEWDTGIAP